MAVKTYSELIAEIAAGRADPPPNWWTGPELEQLLTDMIDSLQNRDPFINDYTIIADTGTTYSPPNGTNICYLPPEWTGRRIRVFRNGAYFSTTKYTHLSNGIQLTQSGDTFQPEEEISVVEY